jgi:hypothetical protein
LSSCAVVHGEVLIGAGEEAPAHRGNTQYTSNRYYALKFKYIEAPEPFKWIWKAKVTKKLKIFIWLVFRDRINSRNLLKRKNFKIGREDYNCVLCNLDIEEYTYHLIFQCLSPTPSMSFQ